MARPLLIAQIDESCVRMEFFFHVPQCIDLVHEREQHYPEHHGVIMSLISSMGSQVFLKVYLLDDVQECPHRIVFIDPIWNIQWHSQLFCAITLTFPKVITKI